MKRFLFSIFFLSAFGTQAQIILNSYSQLAATSPISISGRTNLISFGNSITVGGNASPASNSYVNLFKTGKSFSTNTNYAVSGIGVLNQTIALQGIGFTRNLTVCTFAAGLNDVRRGGSAAKTLNKIEQGFRVCTLKMIGAGNVYAGDAAVTRTGTWSGFAANTVGGLGTTGTLPCAGCAANSTGPIGDKISWTFTGVAFGIQFSACDGVISTYSDIDIKVDGVTVKSTSLNNLYDGISDGSNANNRGPAAWYFFNLTNTSHTVEVVKTTTGNMPVDFFSLIQTPANSTAMLYCEIPYLNTTGYALAPNSGSVAASDLASARIISVVLELKSAGYPAVYVPINRYYNLATGLDTDNIHPNNTGHSQFYSALNASVF